MDDLFTTFVFSLTPFILLMIRFKNILILLYTILFLPVTARAQDACGFDKLFQQQLKENPMYRQVVEQAENHWAQYSRTMRESGRKFSVLDTDEVYEIPVVIHILHTGGEVGTNYNPTNQTMTEWINYLNQVYEASYAGYPQAGNGGVKMPVKFVLAKRDPDCKPTNGIHRVDMSSYPDYVSHGVRYDENNGLSVNQISELIQWSKEAYYNIYVVNKIDGGDGYNGGSWAGFAYYGISNPLANVDGTYILARYSAKQYSTLPHEIGHAFGLRHTWHDGDETKCSLNDNCDQQGDLVCDTDPSYNLRGKCPLATDINPCTGAPFGVNGVQNNFMNYSSCIRNHFTPGQAERMMFMLRNYRPGLIHSLANVEPTAVNEFVPVSAQCIPTEILNPGNRFLIGPANVMLDSIQYFSTGYSKDHDTRYYIDNTLNCLFKTHTSLIVQTPYSLSVSTTTNGHKIKAYIDYNNDGTFDEEEKVMDVSSSKPDTTYSVQITVPFSAVKNTPLRMRVIGDYNSVGVNPSPCGNLTYGQTEDFSVTIVDRDALFTGLTDFMAKQSANHSIALYWKIENAPVNISGFEIERSEDGKLFKSVASVARRDGKQDYQYIDVNTIPGQKYFYRLKIVNAGRAEYSRVVSVSPELRQTAGYQIFPNPFSEQFTLKADKPVKEISIFDLYGRKLMQKEIVGSSGYEIKVNLTNHPGGIYLIKITGLNGEVSWKRMLKE